MIHIKKQTHRSMEQNRKPSNKPIHMATNIQQGCQQYRMGKRQSPQQMMLRKLDIHKRNNETGSLSYTKVNSKLITDLIVRP